MEIADSRRSFLLPPRSLSHKLYVRTFLEETLAALILCIFRTTDAHKQLYHQQIAPIVGITGNQLREVPILKDVHSVVTQLSHNFNITQNNIIQAYVLYHLQLTKLYNKATYVLECWYTLKMAINNSRSMKEGLYIQEVVQSVGDELGYTGMRRITTFRSTTDRIYDSGSIRLYHIIIHCIIIAYSIQYSNMLYRFVA
jgi:hypothetical protein